MQQVGAWVGVEKEVRSNCLGAPAQVLRNQARHLPHPLAPVSFTAVCFRHPDYISQNKLDMSPVYLSRRCYNLGGASGRLTNAIILHHVL